MSIAINRPDFANRTLQKIKKGQGYSWNLITLQVIQEYVEMVEIITKDKSTFGVDIYYEALKLKKIMKEQIPEHFT